MEHGQLDPSSLQRMLYDTLDLSDAIVLVLRQNGDDAADVSIASANDAFCRTTGHAHEELIDRPFLALVAEEGRTRWSGIVRDTREKGSSRSEQLCRRKDDTTF